MEQTDVSHQIKNKIKKKKSLVTCKLSQAILYTTYLLYTHWKLNKYTILYIIFMLGSFARSCDAWADENEYQYNVIRCLFNVVYAFGMSNISH